MKVIGLTLLRNERLIIQETLDHFGHFCTGGIYVIDDCSDDGTYEIAKSHPSVVRCERVPQDIHDPQKWPIHQSIYRQSIYNLAVEHAEPGDWFLYFDADERIEYEFSHLKGYDERVFCVYMKLYDFYITPEDSNLKYSGDLTTLRTWCGPEYRPIMFLFKHTPERRWRWKRSRVPDIDHARELAVMDGYARHYGKCISLSQWEDTCDFYVANSPQYAEKWQARKGKAIHTVSDFGNPLITWDQKEAYGINVSAGGGTSPDEIARIRWWYDKRYVKEEPDYSHLSDKALYKCLYDEVGSLPANQAVLWREEWMRHFRPSPGATILELGAHNGPNLLHYGRIGHHVTGVELSETLISTFERYLRAEAKAVQQRVRMVQGWIEEFDTEERYDNVLCAEVLEHVQDPVAILMTARRCVKEQGQIYIVSPSTLWGNNTHVRGVSPEDLLSWLGQAGLQAVSIFTEVGRTFCLASPILD